MTTLTLSDDERTCVVAVLRWYAAAAREAHRPDEAQLAARIIARLTVARARS